MILLQSKSDKAEKRRRRISRNHGRLMDLNERDGLRRLNRFYAKFLKTIFARVKQIGVVGFSDLDVWRPGEFTTAFNTQFLPLVNRGAWSGIQFETDHIGPERQSLFFGRRLFTQELVDPEPPPSIHVDVSPELQEAVKEYLRQKEQGVWSRSSWVVRSRLRRAIETAIQDGESFDQMQKRIQKNLRNVSKAQARRIARSETTGAMNYGQQVRRTDLGIEFKEWVSRIDNRTRGRDPKDIFDHLGADGEVVKNNEPFQRTGEPMMFPGDSNGSAGNVCNCRCSSVSHFDD